MVSITQYTAGSLLVTGLQEGAKIIEKNLTFRNATKYSLGLVLLNRLDQCAKRGLILIQSESKKGYTGHAVEGQASWTKSFGFPLTLQCGGYVNSMDKPAFFLPAYQFQVWSAIYVLQECTEGTVVFV